MPCETSDLARISDPVKRCHAERLPATDQPVVRRYPNFASSVLCAGAGVRPCVAGRFDRMSHGHDSAPMKRPPGLGIAPAPLAWRPDRRAPARARSSTPRRRWIAISRSEWSRAGRNLNGYVYNTGNRRAAHMILLVEGALTDPAGRQQERRRGFATFRPTTGRSSRSRCRPRGRLSGVGSVLRLGRGPAGSPQGQR